MLEKIVLIGASTGGPGHIKTLLDEIRLNSASIIIAQHMDEMFIPSFASQIQAQCNLPTEFITKRVQILPNKVYVCQTNCEILASSVAQIRPNLDAQTAYSPNVDLLFSSATDLCKNYKIMAILLTGIGDDGAIGLKALFDAGAKCIGENEESAIVYGMPKQANEINPLLKMMNLSDIKTEFRNFLNVF